MCRTFWLRVSWKNQERAIPGRWALVTGGVTGQSVSTGECFFCNLLSDLG